MPENKRRFRQFSLRSLLAVMTLAAIWFGWHNSRSRIQRTAVQELEAAGVQVLYDFQVDQPTSASRKLPYPPWLVNLLGIDFFATAVGVEGHGVRTPGLDESLSALRQLPSVRYVHFGGSQLGDAGMKHIAELGALERLGLEYTTVSAAGLAELQQARRLKRLFLKGLPVEDETLDQLAGIVSLELVELNGSQVSEAGVGRLSASLPHCKIDWDANYR